MSSSGLEDSDQGSNGENGETDSSSIAGAEISEAKTCEDSTDKGGIVTARGSGTGLIIRADGRVAEDSLRSALEDFVSSRQSFLAGNAIDIEWVGKKPAESFARELLADLKERYGVEVASSGLRQKGRKSEGASHGKQVDGQKAGSQKTASKSSSKVSAIGLVEDVGLVEG